MEGGGIGAVEGGEVDWGFGAGLESEVGCAGGGVLDFCGRYQGSHL